MVAKGFSAMTSCGLIGALGCAPPPSPLVDDQEPKARKSPPVQSSTVQYWTPFLKEWR